MTAIIRPDGPPRRVRLGSAGLCSVRTGELVAVLRSGPGLRVEYLPTLETEDHDRATPGVPRPTAAVSRRGAD